MKEKINTCRTGESATDQIGNTGSGSIESDGRGSHGENEKLLLRILEQNKDTEYGRKYGFANIHSIEEYQKKVPVSVYDDYAGYIFKNE